MKKLKFENIFTNQHALSANLKKNFQKHENKTIIQSIKYLLYNTKLNEPSSDFIDDEFDENRTQYMHEISSKTARIMQLEEEIKKKEKEFDHLFSKKRYLMLTLKIICPVCSFG